MTATTFSEFVTTRFGVLKTGTHEPDGEACALEAVSQWRGIDWTDEPEETGLPDLRPINDAAWSTDEARTAAMIRLVEALDGWADWPIEHRRQWAERVVIETVRQIVAELPGLPEDTARQCHEAESLADAAAAARYASVLVAARHVAAVADRAAAYAAAQSAAWDAAWDAARAAAHAAAYAAAAARDAARAAAAAAVHAADDADDAARAAAAAAVHAGDRVLTTAVDIWCEAAEEVRA